MTAAHAGTAAVVDAPAGDLAAVAARIRERVVHMCAGPEGGHLGGALSAVDILTTLYFSSLDLGPATVEAADRDLVVLSKGHAGAALYATLVERGILESVHTDRYGEPGTLLGGHPSRGVPGVELPTGSLGHGLGLGVGLALSRRLRRRPGRVVVVVGDGELQEGAVWEAAVIAAARRLGRLTLVVDRNGLQQSAATGDVTGAVSPVAGLAALGWRTVEVDGHDLAALTAVLDPELPADGPPTLVVADTVKARGIGFLQGQVGSHFVSLDQRRLARTLRALRGPVAVAPPEESS